MIRLAVAILALVAATPAALAQTPPFATQTPPPAPDYDDPASWASTPRQPGASALVPGAQFADRTERQSADIFYIHPTTLRSATRWNQAVDDEATNAWTDNSVIARQASIFNQCCRIFAPRYRQASTLAFVAMEGDGADAYALAYRDIERAFDHYMTHENQGRAFVLVGHSQGALHVRRLLTQRIAGRPVAARMVVAYAIGLGLSVGEFDRDLKPVAACDRADQTGCVLAWNARLVGSDVSGFVARTKRAYSAVHDAGNPTLLCINPLTFDRNVPNAPRGRSRGALPGAVRAGALPALVPDAVAARCEGGVLMVDPDPALEMPPLPGGNMHYHDMTLFYDDIRVDVARRINAFGRRANR